MLKTYGDKIHFVYRHYPLPNHPNARPAAEAAACAGDRAVSGSITTSCSRMRSRLTDADLKQHAAAAGLDAANSTRASTATIQGEVDKDVAEANEAGVSGTPAFFINGRALEGAQPFEAFKRVIDEELAAKKR